MLGPPLGSPQKKLTNVSMCNRFCLAVQSTKKRSQVLASASTHKETNWHLHCPKNCDFDPHYFAPFELVRNTQITLIE